MKRGLTLALMLSCGMWVVSQSQPSGSSGSPQTSGGYGQSGSDQSQSRIEGCLAGSSGNYTLTDNKTGTTYQLSGDTSKLSEHVNESVEISGTKGTGSSGSASSGSTSGSTSGGTSSGGQQTFNVTSVKKISSSCSPSSK